MGVPTTPSAPLLSLSRRRLRFTGHQCRSLGVFLLRESTSVTLPSSLTSIGPFAFKLLGASFTKSITPPADLDSIGSAAFLSGDGFGMGLDVATGVSRFHSSDGVLFRCLFRTELIAYPVGRGGALSDPPECYWHQGSRVSRLPESRRASPYPVALPASGEWGRLACRAGAKRSVRPYSYSVTSICASAFVYCHSPTSIHVATGELNTAAFKVCCSLFSAIQSIAVSTGTRLRPSIPNL